MRASWSAVGSASEPAKSTSRSAAAFRPPVDPIAAYAQRPDSRHHFPYAGLAKVEPAPVTVAAAARGTAPRSAAVVSAGAHRAGPTHPRPCPARRTTRPLPEAPGDVGLGAG